MKSSKSTADEFKGYIYILENSIYDNQGIVKIGYASNPEQREKDLNNHPGVATPFRLYATYEVKRKLEDETLFKLIEGINPDLRVVEQYKGKKRKREFFKMGKEEAYRMLECIAQISGTIGRLKKIKQDKDAIAEDKAVKETRLGAFSFGQCGIKPGAILKFVKDPGKTAEVVDDKRVRYDNYVTSLSSLAKDLLGSNYGVQGPRYFTYKGKLLTKIRDEKFNRC